MVMVMIIKEDSDGNDDEDENEINDPLKLIDLANVVQSLFTINNLL